MKLTMKLQLGALFLAACTGCTYMPPDVAAELSPPDGKRPNHYATSEMPTETDTPAEVVTQ